MSTRTPRQATSMPSAVRPQARTIHAAGTALTQYDRPDWRRAEDYAALTQADRRAFAWEWLRRTPAYATAWRQHCEADPDGTSPRYFGLEQFEDPTYRVPVARPIWCAMIDPSVIACSIHNVSASNEDRIDLRRLADMVSVAIDDEAVEHLLFSDGCRGLRIDILEGTLIGCPSSVRYLLDGITSLSGRLETLTNLAGLVQTGRLQNLSRRDLRRQERWILELRISDAIAAGTDQQDIARAIFGPLISDRRWRRDSAPYRQRVQRLVRSAQRRLAAPLDPRWFALEQR